MTIVCTPAIVDFPSEEQYDAAMSNRNLTVSDPIVKSSSLLQSAAGPIHLNSGTSPVVVYKVGDQVVRCFKEGSPPDICERYREIKSFMDSKARGLSFLVPFTWVDQAITVGGRFYPFIKTQFIADARTLGSFVQEKHKDSHAMRQLAELVRSAARDMESLGMAHGDLDLTNILVISSTGKLAIKLIDYDGMFIPQLQGKSVTDAGHEHFQPATPDVREFSPELDRFSVLVLYLCLLAIAHDADLWASCGANEEDRLLLQRDPDYFNPDNSENFKRLQTRSAPPDLQRCLRELDASIRENRMPRSLEDVLRDKLPARPYKPVPPPDLQPDPGPGISTVKPPPTLGGTTPDGPSVGAGALPPVTPPPPPDEPQRERSFTTMLRDHPIAFVLVVIVAAVLSVMYLF